MWDCCFRGIGRTRPPGRQLHQIGPQVNEDLAEDASQRHRDGDDTDGRMASDSKPEQVSSLNADAPAFVMPESPSNWNTAQTITLATALPEQVQQPPLLGTVPVQQSAKLTPAPGLEQVPHSLRYVHEVVAAPLQPMGVMQHGTTMRTPSTGATAVPGTPPRAPPRAAPLPNAGTMPPVPPLPGGATVGGAPARTPPPPPKAYGAPYYDMKQTPVKTKVSVYDAMQSPVKTYPAQKADAGAYLLSLVRGEGGPTAASKSTSGQALLDMLQEGGRSKGKGGGKQRT